MTFVKICGLTGERDIASAAKAGADAIGIMCVETSPRFVPHDRATELANFAKSEGAIPVFVTSGKSDIYYALHDGIFSGAWLQLHGAETPDQVSACAKYTRVPIIKAVSVASADDLKAIDQFAAADRFLLDAKPPAGADREGGHGATFDWSILKGWTAPKPWILAGGLTPENVAEAIETTGATAVDVSSGVESSPGVKDVAKIRDFIQAAKSASNNGAAA